MRKDHGRKEKKDHIIGSPEKEKKKINEEIKDIIYSPIVDTKITFKIIDINRNILILCFLRKPEKQKKTKKQLHLG